MTIFELMDSKRNTYSKNDLRIYNNIKKFPDAYATLSFTELIEETGFSQASLTRFAKKIGFNGFQEFQYQFIQDYNSRHEHRQLSRSEVYGELLTLTEKQLKEELIHNLCARIQASHKVYFSGTSLARMPAEYLDISLKIIGYTNTEFLPVDILYGHATKEDTLIFFSAHTGILATDFMERIKRHNATPHMILVTMNPKHSLRKYFDEVILLPDISSSYIDQSVVSDTFSFFMLIDLIMNRMNQLNAEKEDGENRGIHIY